jgi:peptide/nickel transport system substrate-binding protein
MKAKALGTILCGSLVLSGCAGGAAGGGGDGSGKKVAYAAGGTFTEALISDPGNLHPLKASQNTTNEVVSFTYDSLVNLDEHGNVVPQLAQKWRVTPTSVTYTLRQDVTCGDGTRLTARQVADTFVFVKNPKNQSSVIGDELPDADFTVKADDAAGTVTVKVARPYAFLLQGAGLVPIVCPKGLADPASLARASDGTGPFRVVENVPDDHLTLAARKDYKWGPNGARTAVPGFPDKLVFKIVKDEATTANLLLSGQLNTATLAGPDVRRLEGRGYERLTAWSGPEELWFNQRAGHPGADIAVRRALTNALDLDQLVKVATQGSGTRATALAVIEPRVCRIGSVAGQLPGHDDNAARTALDQAGWKAGPDGVRTKAGRRLTITLRYNSDAGPAVDAAMELIRTWWKGLGVDVKLKGASANAYTQALFGGNDWDAAWLGISLAFPNQLISYASGPPSPAGQNFAAVSNADYRRLVAKALTTPGEASCPVWAQADQALLRNLDLVPVANNRILTFAAKSRFTIGISGPEPTSLRILKS